MVRVYVKCAELAVAGLLWATCCGQAMAWGQAGEQQDSSAAHLVETGQVVQDGHPVPYRVRHLPINSFPEIPAGVADLLSRRGCLIPQTYAARRPENVVHASLERTGSSDWAALCSVQGTVSLLVVFGSNPGQATVLASAPETQRLQVHDVTGVMGFNWGIDPASPELVHEAQTGMEHRPPRPDHDALADVVVDRRTIYHFYSKNGWTLVELPD